MFLYEQFLAIDYGTSFIKGILFQRSMGNTTVIREESLKIVSVEEEEDEYEYNIVRFINSFFPNEKNILINLPLNRLFIREFQVPLTTEKAVREVIPFEVEGLIPFSMDHMEVMGSIWKIEEERSNVITFSSHHNELTTVLSPFMNGDYNLKALFVDSVSLAAIVKQHYQKEIQSSFVGQIDLGGKLTTFNAMVEGRLAHSRYNAMGEVFLTEEIADSLDTDLDRAEEIKTSIHWDIFQEEEEEELASFLKHWRIKPNQWKECKKRVLKHFEDIASEIRRSILSLPEDYRPEIIYLSGGGAKWSGIISYLENLLDTPISGYDFLETPDPSSVTCVGMAYQYSFSGRDQIDFLKTPFVKRVHKNAINLELFIPHILFASISAFVLVGVFFVGIIIDKRKIAANEVVLRDQFRKGFNRALPPGADVIASADQILDQEKRKTELYRLFLSKKSVLDVIYDISSTFPPADSQEFKLDQFSYNGTSVTLQGRVDKSSSVYDIKNALEKSNRFKKVDLNHSSQIPGTNTWKYRFSIVLTLKDGE